MLRFRLMLIIIIAVALPLTAIVVLVWYVFMPESVREYCRKHPEYDLRGNMRKASNLEIRLKGIFIFIFCCLMETGLIIFLTDFKI